MRFYLFNPNKSKIVDKHARLLAAKETKYLTILDMLRKDSK